MSSYISPAPQGDDKATGAWAIAIAETAGGTNNDGHATDSAGNVIVDFAWGNFPLQPNDVRRASVTNFGGERGSDDVTVITDGPMRDIPGEGADYGWDATTMVTSGNLPYGSFDVTLNNGITRTVKPDSNPIAGAAYSSYPSWTSGTGNYIVTAATGDGSTVTYTSMNWLNPGDTVSITGCPNSAFNLSSQTVVTATRQSFTVSNSAGSGVTVTGFYGKVQDPNALSNTDGAYISGTAYITVPNVVGLTTALAQDALNDAEFGTITVASAVTPAISNVALTSNVATLTTSAAHGYAVGDSVVIASLVNGAGNASADADLNGTYTLTTGTTGSTLKFAKTHTDITTHSVSAGTAKVMAKAGTIKTQSVAAGASSIAAGTSITITPYFAS